jgi:hypothetical protein
MNKKLSILFFLVLILIAGCFPKEEFQSKLEVGLESLFESGMFVTTAASVYCVENGHWPDSTETLKKYCYSKCKETKIIDWDNYKIQTVFDNEGEKLKIDYKSAKISYSSVFSKPVYEQSKSTEPIPKEEFCEMFKQLIGIEEQ